MTGSETQNREIAQILVVDDTPANLKLLNEMLTNQGYRVRPASNGRLALRSVAAALPDLILLDVRMPDMDGYEVCSRLKSDEYSRGVPVIFISALDSVSDKIKGFEAGGIDYVTKPFQEAEVLARVETHLSLRRLQKKLEEQNLQLQREIAARICSEEELKRHQEHLEERIAERTRELNEAVSKYRGIFENSVEGIFQLSPEGSFLSCNPALADILGYEGPDEVIGSISDIGVSLFVHPHRHAELSALFFSKHDVKNFEVELFRKDGSILWALLNIRPLYDEAGNLLFIDGILQDITGRKAAQQALLENARIKRELEIAQEIQQSFLPYHLPKLPGLLTACRCVPAANVGGDYYDFFYPSANILDVVIADVAGHSIGSALLMTETRSVLHARAGFENTPGKLLAVVNDLLHEDLSRAELLNSMFYARLDLNNHTLTYASAGHTRSQFFRSRDGSFEELDADGLLMGIRREVFFEEKEIEVAAGDTLLLYTDGISESENTRGEFFGTVRLHDVIAEHRDCSPDEMITAVFQKVSDFTGSKAHADDMTMVIIKVN
jgi:PAS domain S-box-containing protein